MKTTKSYVSGSTRFDEIERLARVAVSDDAFVAALLGVEECPVCGSFEHEDHAVYAHVRIEARVREVLDANLCPIDADGNALLGDVTVRTGDRIASTFTDTRGTFRGFLVGCGRMDGPVVTWDQ